jgi:polyisoprenoid-binding protein YceI
MKNVLFITAIAVLAMSCTPKNAEEASTGEAKSVSEAAGVEYSLNTADSEIHWRGTKPGGEHYGTVSATSGSVNVENGSLTGGIITIDLTSIVNEDLSGDMNARLVGHLLSEDFFYTEEYPEAVFEITSVEKFSGEAPEEGLSPTHNITGNLTMRGETKSITFPAMVTISDNAVMAESNEFAIDRTLWGVNFKSKTVFAEFKDDFISDMMNLKIKAKFENN